MSEDQIKEIFLLVIKIAAIVAITLNAGVGIMLLRQVTNMNNVLHVRSGSFMTMLVLGFLVIVSFALLYAILS